jgi:hypothetical protein
VRRPVVELELSIYRVWLAVEQWLPPGLKLRVMMSLGPVFEPSREVRQSADTRPACNHLH